MRVALALLVAASWACQALRPMSAGEQFIQGAWHWSQDLGDGHASYREWTFDAGKFTVESYPPLYQTGPYRVLREDGDTLVLGPAGQEGDWPADDREMIVVLDQTAGTLRIDNSGPYSRAVP